MSAWTKLKQGFQLLYPFIIFWSIRNSHQAWAVAFAFLSVGINLNFQRKSVLWGQLLLLAIFGVLSFYTGAESLIRVSPLLISLSFLLIFWQSLGQEKSILEVYGQSFKKISPSEALYLRKATKVWIGFLILNSSLLFYFSFWGSLKAWMLYSGFIFYILSGFLLLGCIAVAKLRKLW